MINTKDVVVSDFPWNNSQGAAAASTKMILKYSTARPLEDLSGFVRTRFGAHYLLRQIVMLKRYVTSLGGPKHQTMPNRSWILQSFRIFFVWEWTKPGAASRLSNNTGLAYAEKRSTCPWLKVSKKRNALCSDVVAPHGASTRLEPLRTYKPKDKDICSL